MFADVDMRIFNIDPRDIERRITEIKAVVAVHFDGQPCLMEEIDKLEKNTDYL